MVQSTISQIEINQVLIGHAEFCCQCLEIGDSALVQSDRDRLLELLDVGVFLPFHFAEVIMFSHDSPPVVCLLFLVCFPSRDDSDY